MIARILQFLALLRRSGYGAKALARFDAWRYRYPRGRPRVGQWIYVPGAIYLSHGRDDFAGGRSRVTQVVVGRSAGSLVYDVEVEADPGTSYNWSGYLAFEQRRLRAAFGEQLAHPNPDYRAEFNRDSWP